MEAIAHLLKGGGRSVEQVEGETTDEGKSGGDGDGDGDNQEGQPKKGGRRMSVIPLAPSSDALDMLGFDHGMAAPNSEDIDGFFPTERPDNPFDSGDVWDPFADSIPAPNSKNNDNDIANFFGEPQGQGEVQVLPPVQDSVWGEIGGSDPFQQGGPDPFEDPFGSPPQTTPQPQLTTKPKENAVVENFLPPSQPVTTTKSSPSNESSYQPGRDESFLDFLLV
eukprot:TRINITY_DN6492_c0_g1_i2.p1 TRINITY_DN6492_c0_g1~~TRINITY_DN6492_c0_g1_i2.p1  ORF type:complete len:222 (+),score=64.37 TRINITY_DN6492_c0_g1_i2:1369-2034(+)